MKRDGIEERGEAEKRVEEFRRLYRRWLVVGWWWRSWMAS